MLSMDGGRFGSLSVLEKRCYETEVSFRSRRLLGRALSEELRRGRAKDERRRRRSCARGGGGVRWMSVPRIAYDIVPPTLRGFVRFTFFLDLAKSVPPTFRSFLDPKPR